MSQSIRKPERATQNRVVALFKDQLEYIYLGNLEDKHDNSNIEAGLLRQYLAEQGYGTEQISKALGACPRIGISFKIEEFSKNKHSHIFDIASIIF